MAIGSSTTPSKTNDVEAIHEAKRRNNNPGVRLVGNRIYCPLNGKTCHQCRQKTLDFAASCRNPKGNKECPIKFCQKCLKNRYGESASDVAKLDDWKCPKCRGICNCSFCMKKRGQKPTGILVHAAKSCGFGSVSEMLSLANPDRSDNVHALCSPRKLGKENSPEKSNTLGLGGEGRQPKAKKVSSKKRKFEGSVGVGKNLSESDVPRDEAGNEFVSMEGKMSKVVDFMELAGPNKFSDNHARHKGIDNPETLPVQRDEEVLTEEVMARNPIKEIKSSRRLWGTNTMLPEVPLPQGKILTTVCTIELPIEVIGDTLQFLEFCSAFGKVIDLRKGEAEVIVRELFSGRPKRNGRDSSLVRIHIKLLSIIMKDSGNESLNVNSAVRKNSWLRDVENCLSELPLASKWLSRCSFDGGLSDYDELDLTGKFRLLNFLCDEALGTEPFRSWIEDQNQKFRDNGKIAKEKLVSAKDKEKQLKQKLLSEVAEAVISKNGAPLSISEHEAVVAKVKHEIAEARAEMAQLSDLTWKKRQRSDAVRTQPILVDPRGLAFWKLSASIGEVDVLLQDLSSSRLDEYEEKWFSYDEAEKEAISKYISSRIPYRTVDGHFRGVFLLVGGAQFRRSMLSQLTLNAAASSA